MLGAVVGRERGRVGGEFDMWHHPAKEESVGLPQRKWQDAVG